MMYEYGVYHCTESYHREIGTGVRINCISPGQIDVGVDLNGFDMKGMKYQLPPATLQSVKVRIYS